MSSPVFLSDKQTTDRSSVLSTDTPDVGISEEEEMVYTSHALVLPIYKTQAVGRDGDAPTSVAQATEDLMELMKSHNDLVEKGYENEIIGEDDLARSSHYHHRIEELVQFLEKSYTPIQTTPFMMMALSGIWHKRYSNTVIRKPDPMLKCSVYEAINYTPNSPKEHIGANFNSGVNDGNANASANVNVNVNDNGGGDSVEKRTPQDITQGELTKITRWNYTEYQPMENLPINSYGDFHVKCNFEINSRGGFFVTITDMLCLPVETPHDFQELVTSIQRTIPFESFDPDQTTVAHTYISPVLRVSRISGDKYSKVLNVFVRETPISYWP